MHLLEQSHEELIPDLTILSVMTKIGLGTLLLTSQRKDLNSNTSQLLLLNGIQLKELIRRYIKMKSQAEKTSESDLRNVADFIAEVTAEILGFLSSRIQENTTGPKK